MDDAFKDLLRALKQAPVMGAIHPLVPLCLPGEVTVLKDAGTVVMAMDDPAPHSEHPVLISTLDHRYKDRFITWNHADCPSPELINRALPKRHTDARRLLLTHRQVADRIVDDVRHRGYQAVALLLIDGLSYDDTLSWPERPEPCFIDGPTITYSQLPDETIASDVGFPGIVGTPPLFRRLTDLGLQRARGYSYWGREEDVSAVLFQGIPLTKVDSTSKAFAELADMDLSGMYIQLVREGLDGLAHRRRELTPEEIQTTAKAIHRDFTRLVEVLAASECRGAVYLIADHGILWKRQHAFSLVEGPRSQSSRYSLNRPSSPGVTSRFRMQHQTYYLYHFPYLGRRIASNDSGVHGGLSYWESIVPFVHVEVNV